MSEQDQRLSVAVFADAAGDYYLVPQHLIQQSRVPAEHKAVIERLLADGATEGHEGHAYAAAASPGLTPSQAVYVGTVLLVHGDLEGLPLLNWGLENAPKGDSTKGRPV